MREKPAGTPFLSHGGASGLATLGKRRLEPRHLVFKLPHLLPVRGFQLCHECPPLHHKGLRMFLTAFGQEAHRHVVGNAGQHLG